jgi:alpha-2-macroglobulin
MNLPPAATEAVRRYLDDVRRALAGRPEEIRRTLCADLEQQIHDALAQRAGDQPPTPADVEAVLAAMDAPEAFAAADPLPPPRPAGPRGWLWFALAVAALAVNIAGWSLANRRERMATVLAAAPEKGGVTLAGRDALLWRFSADMRPDPTPARLTPEVKGTFSWPDPRTLRFTPNADWPAGLDLEATLEPTVRTADERPLESALRLRAATPDPTLLSVTPMEFTDEREATLRLLFNGIPDAAALERTLTFRDEFNAPVDWTFAAPVTSPAILVRTEFVKGERMALTLAPGLRLAQAPRLSRQTSSHTVALAAAPALLGVRATSPSFGPPTLQLVFNQPMDAGGAADFIRVDPAVRFTAERWSTWNGEGLALAGAFEPGQVYTVSLREGLRGRAGQRLPANLSRTVQFPDREPALQFSAEGRYLSPRGPMRLPVTAVNLREVTLHARPVPASNLAFFALRDQNLLGASWAYSDDVAAGRLTGPAVSRTVPLPDRPNQQQSLHVDLADLLGADARGVHLIELNAGGKHGTARLVAVSDLGLTLKRERDAVSAWITSIRGATPIADVEVTILASNTQPLARGRTDADGWARLPLPPSSDADLEPLVALVTTTDDVNFLILPGAQLDLPDARGAPYAPPGALEAMVYTDRGLYRPGETVRIQTLVRDPDGAAPAPFPALLRIVRPDGRTHRDLPLTLNERGAASLAVALPDYLPSGAYELRVTLPGGEPVLGATRVQMESFVPPQVAAAWQTPDGRIRAGAPLRATLSARFLFGRAAAGLPAQPSVIFEPAPFTPTAWPDHAFGDAEKTFGTLSENLARTRLNDEGVVEVTASTSDAWRPPAALRARWHAAVIEPGGRPVYAIAETILDPYPFYIGLRARSGRATLAVGTAAAVHVVTVSPDGLATNAVSALKAVWARAAWSHTLQRGEQGVYHWVSERILTPEQESIVVLGENGGEVTVTPARTGEHVLTLTDPASGASSSLSFHAHDPGARWTDASRARPDRVEVRWDRESAAPGDTAELSIRSPFPVSRW